MPAVKTVAPPLRYDVLESPIGPLLLAADDAGLRHVVFSTSLNRQSGHIDWLRDTSLLIEPRRQLQAYFGGELMDFDLALAADGTAFQMSAWRALTQIPYGETRSYAEQAAAIGSPRAVRAIGSANGRNPLPIVVPCHRVIGKDGSLTGFGGGLPAKQWLLRHEQSSARTSAVAVPLLP